MAPLAPALQNNKVLRAFLKARRLKVLQNMGTSTEKVHCQAPIFFTLSGGDHLHSFFKRMQGYPNPISRDNSSKD